MVLLSNDVGASDARILGFSAEEVNGQARAALSLRPRSTLRWRNAERVVPDRIQRCSGASVQQEGALEGALKDRENLFVVDHDADADRGARLLDVVPDRVADAGGGDAEVEAGDAGP